MRKVYVNLALVIVKFAVAVVVANAQDVKKERFWLTEIVIAILVVQHALVSPVMNVFLALKILKFWLTVDVLNAIHHALHAVTMVQIVAHHVKTDLNSLMEDVSQLAVIADVNHAPLMVHVAQNATSLKFCLTAIAWIVIHHAKLVPVPFLTNVWIVRHQPNLLMVNVSLAMLHV
jgi:hypothetical protein